MEGTVKDMAGATQDGSREGGAVGEKGWGGAADQSEAHQLRPVGSLTSAPPATKQRLRTWDCDNHLCPSKFSKRHSKYLLGTLKGGAE